MAKLRKIQSERVAAESSLTSTGAELAIGAGVLLDALDLMSDPSRPTPIRRRDSTQHQRDLLPALLPR